MGAQLRNIYHMKQLPLAALFGTSLLCLSISPLLAAEQADTLDNIVVTADRKARTVDETLAPVTIITRKDIEKYQATDVAEVLRRVPGINISNNGGVGKQTSVFLRGTASNHVLVLVDGVKIGSATTGATAFEHVPLDQVERIEVVRGPRSSLYGSEAIGGVIQIFTRKGGKGFRPEVNISAGSHNTQEADVNLAGGNQTTWYNLNAGHSQTDGINACNSATSGCFMIEPDKDGYRRKSASLRAGHRFANGTELEASLSRSQGKNFSDGDIFSGNSNDFVQENLSGKIKHRLGERVAISAQIGQSRDESYSYFNGGDLNPFASRQFNTRRNTASLQTDVTLNPDAALTVGMDTQKDNVTSDNNYTVKSRKNDGLFASYQHTFGKANLEVSARSDDNEQFGKHNTGAVAVGYNISDNLRMTASHGKAFRAPTFNELYWPGAGDPNLKPEKSTNTEIGLNGKWVNGNWSANVFENKINDMIPVWPPSNIDKATIRGVELGASTKLAGWDVNANVTLQNPKNAAGVNDGKLLLRRPKQIANVDIDRKLGNIRVGATVHAESERYDNPANTPASRLSGYGTLDLRADYQMAKDWAIGAKVGNILDKKYQTAQGYNQDGINGLVTLKYAPK